MEPLARVGRDRRLDFLHRKQKRKRVLLDDRRGMLGDLECKIVGVLGEKFLAIWRESIRRFWRNHVRRFGEIVFGDLKKRARRSYSDYILEFIMK